MKRLRYLALFAAILGTFVFATAAAAAPKQATVGTLLSGLINVNVQNVAVDVDTGDITLVGVGDITLVNVEDSLNDNQIEILKNVLNNSPIASNNSNILNNLLRDANLITDNQIVVGVLGGTFFVADLVP
jgi:hypothetical protein